MKIFIILSSVLFLAIGTKNYLFPIMKISEKSESITINHINSSPFNGKQGTITIIRIRKNYFNYKVVNKSHTDFNFYVNSNYFSTKPVGEVIINGKKISQTRRGGGFFTSNGKTPKFYFGSHPKVKYSSQTHTVALIEGNLNYRIFKYKWAKYRLPRLLIGEDKLGNLILIHSNINGGCSIESISRIAKTNGVYNGLIFDGGASIEIGIKSDGINYHYQQVPDVIRKINGTPTPWVFIVGQ